MNSLDFYNINIKTVQDRFVVIDDEATYYVWQLYFSNYLATLEIVAFVKKDHKFIEIKTTKVNELIEYLKFRLLDKNTKEITNFFNTLASYFSIPQNIIEEYGEDFCKQFLQDSDSRFLFRDLEAKHWELDFEKIKNKDDNFLKEPTLLPFYISELDVILTKDAKLQKNHKDITIKQFWQIYDEYKKDLIPYIKKKDKIFRKIEKDLKERFFESLAELRKKKIFDYEIQPKIEVFDVLIGEDPFLCLPYTDELLLDESLWSLKVYGLDLMVGRLCWYVLQKLGLKSIKTEFYYWSDIEIKNQKFFRL